MNTATYGDYDSLIGVIYEAARDQLLLKEALAATVSAVGAAAGSLTIFDRQAEAVVMSVTSGTTPVADLDYAERYAGIDPRAQISMRAPLAEWGQCHQYFSPAYVEQSEFYQDFLIPYGFRWISGTRLFDADVQSGIIGIHSAVDQEPISEDGLKLLRQITPHWQRSLNLQRQALALQDQWSMMRSLLNSISYATLVCDSHLSVLVANDAALELLRGGDGIALSGDRISIPDPLAGRHLKSLLATSAQMPSQAPVKNAQGPDGAMLVPRPSGKPSFQLILRKLEPGKTMLNLASADRFILTISDPTGVAIPHIKALALMYELTPAESRLAQCLLGGTSIEEIAKMLDVKLPTLRTQLASIFAKTNTNRQAELVALFKRT